MVLGSVADLLTDDIFLEKILGNYPQPSIDIEQWLRNNYGDSLEEAFAAKTILEGLDRVNNAGTGYQNPAPALLIVILFSTQINSLSALQT